MKNDPDASEFYGLLEKAIEQYSIFVYLFTQKPRFGPRSAQRTETIENITVFAPTNAALQKFLNVSGIIIKDEIDIKVAELLLYHVIDGNMLSSDIFAECNVIEGYVGICDSIPTFTNLMSQESQEKNPLRIHPSTDNFILNINAAQIIGDKSNQIASNGVVHFIDEV